MPAFHASQFPLWPRCEPRGFGKQKNGRTLLVFAVWLKKKIGFFWVGNGSHYARSPEVLKIPARREQASSATDRCLRSCSRVSGGHAKARADGWAVRTGFGRSKGTQRKQPACRLAQAACLLWRRRRTPTAPNASAPRPRAAVVAGFGHRADHDSRAGIVVGVADDGAPAESGERGTWSENHAPSRNRVTPVVSFKKRMPA